jgi:16S rRNA (guanine966-N2)-methyltransferase
MNILGERVSRATVFDFFAGAGTLGIEALSRGADKCIFVEKNRTFARHLQQNLDLLGLAKLSEVVVLDVFAFDSQQRSGTGHIAFVDPPFSIFSAPIAVRNLDSFIERSPQFLVRGGILVVRHNAYWSPQCPSLCKPDRVKDYGDNVVSFFTKICVG